MSFSLYTNPEIYKTKDSQSSGLKITVEGELTIYEASEFKEKLDGVMKDSPVFLEIDLWKIAKMDTSCLQILLALKKEAKRKDASVRLVNHSHSVLRLIDLFGLTGFLRDKIKVSKEERGEFSFQYGMNKD
ncbi:anti-sigma factor antagonist [Leptospira barantonii]|uniref:Anti-sigma factor antagonist n=1 Tax=Leptospira barantonii TaxID=2023184 RepID=A0A5F2BUK5_9LEPT|nr:STAS domain-containing protein [Leptospira barantonii]TGM09862.1 anti-sigma factor antagonist [Leptospira barantonii]